MASDVTDEGEWKVHDTVEHATQLLMYAVERGDSLGPEIRDPILRASAVVHSNDRLTPTEESAFLGAYATLANLLAPVTAATLRASDWRLGRKRWWTGLLGMQPQSDAQVYATIFSVFALALLVIIGVCEFGRTFIVSITEMENRLKKTSTERHTLELQLQTKRRQFEPLAKVPPKDPNGIRMVEALRSETEELTDRQQTLIAEEDNLVEKIVEANGMLSRWVSGLRFWAQGPAGSATPSQRNLIGPLMTLYSGFVMPILFGALGTCAYILRSIYDKMVRRSFDPSRKGEYLVRIFLGMMSAVTMQWLFVGDVAQIGGVKPAGIAFLAGYSVELLFALIDRALAAALASLKAPSATGAAQTGSAEGASDAKAKSQGGLPATAENGPAAQ
jgi:hypothetical protein